MPHRYLSDGPDEASTPLHVEELQGIRGPRGGWGTKYARDSWNANEWMPAVIAQGACGADKLNGLPGYSKPRFGQVQRTEDWGDVVEQLKLPYPEDEDDLKRVKVKLETEEICVDIHIVFGPRFGIKEQDYVDLRDFYSDRGRKQAKKSWSDFTIKEQELCVVRVAKKIQIVREQMGLCKQAIAIQAELEKGGLQDEGQNLSPDEVQEIVRERIQLRCDKELARKPMNWENIEIADVTANSSKKAPGMIYGIEFPWTEQMLHHMGKEWLTKAFQAAGTLPLDNAVKRVLTEKKAKITTGNNGGKFFFEVKYVKRDPTLHTRFFCKIPFALEGATRSDRLNASVNKQPQELYEINTHRLLEYNLPCRTPRYYFGDINNETSNWILITERIEFADPMPQWFGPPKKKKRGPLGPDLIEGPYDKCADWNLRGNPTEYYFMLVREGAKIAGAHKAGKLGDESLLRKSFLDMADKPNSFFGLNLNGATGDDPRTLKPKYDLGEKFITEIGQVLFPDYVTETTFQEKLKNTMFTLNGYQGEIQMWKHSHQDYIAITHQNMNVDNAYYWRNEDGFLQMGVLDWGGMGSMCLGHKLWWWLYCSDYEVFREHHREFVKAFIEYYEKYGGPKLDEDMLCNQMMLTALQQLLSLIKAVPQITTMCPKARWKTINSRYDTCISENIDGKSTLRLYLHVMVSIVRIMEEMEADKVLDMWISGVWENEYKLGRKHPGILDGEIKTNFGL